MNSAPEQATAKKTIHKFAWASFLNDLGSDIIYPIWPIFVTQVLKANMAVLGLIDGLGDAIVSISQALSGYLADKYQKRKIFIWLGYLFGSLSRVGYAISSVWQHLIPFRILDRAGKIRSAPRDAIVADLSTKANRGSHFGLLRMADNAGALLGVLICIGLVNLIGIRNLFLVAAIPSLFGVLIILFQVREIAPKSQVYRGLALRDLDKNFQLFLVLSALFALGAFSYSFLLVYTQQSGFKIAIVPVFYLVFTAVAALVSLPFGKLADRWGRKKVLILSYFFWGLVCLLFIVSSSRISIGLAFVCYGLHKGAFEPVIKTLVSELAPPAFRASTLGAFQMVVGLCALPASLIAGLLWDQIGKLAPFYFSLGLTLLSLFLLLMVKEPSTQS